MKSISLKLSILVCIIVLIFAAFVFYKTSQARRDIAEELLVRETELAMEFNLAIREYVAEQIRPRMKELVGHDSFVPETMSTSGSAPA